MMRAAWLGLMTCMAANAGPGGGGGVRQPAVAVAFVDSLRAPDPRRWQAADWHNGGFFLNRWRPGQLAFTEDGLTITLAPDPRPAAGPAARPPSVSGEYRTRAAHGWGTFSARLMASAQPGAITGFFLYTGPAEGTAHNEIDMEIKGDAPHLLLLNYWTDGREHPTVVELGFDASQGLHDYSFRWSADAIQWFVDDRLVHEERGKRGPLPRVPGRIMLNLWGTTGAQPWSSEYPPQRRTQARITRVAYSPDPIASLHAAGRPAVPSR